MTKLDVLDELETIKIAVAYKKGGEALLGMPASQQVLNEVEVEYVDMPGWQTNISEIRDFEALPTQAQAYVRKVEELSGVPVKWIGVGPAREAMIIVPPRQ